jgi:hypothetical protein
MWLRSPPRAPPTQHSPVAVTLLHFGGPVLYLLAQTCYLREVTDSASRARLAGTATLVIGAGVSRLVAPYTSLALLAALRIGLGRFVIREGSNGRTP